MAQVFSLATPFKLPAYKYLDKTTQREIVTDTTLVHPTTGALLEKESVPFVAADMEKMEEVTELPRMAVLERSAAEALRHCEALGTQHPSLSLVGFWPRSALQLHHQVPLPSQFINSHFIGLLAAVCAAAAPPGTAATGSSPSTPPRACLFALRA